MEDNVLGVLGSAFKLRDGENYLSVTRIEHFSGSYIQNVHDSIREIRKYYNVKPKSHFSVGNVSRIKALYENQQKKPVRIVSYPTKTTLIKDGSTYNNKSHAAVFNLEQNDDELLELLAEEVWCDLHANNSV
jgi:uroporphyrinogen-III decarboxylase